MKILSKREPGMEHFSGKRVLVVDDYPMNREVITRLLQKKGMLVEQACDGRGALCCYQEKSEWYYDLILMDVQMPYLDGLEATRCIRGLARADAREIPIVAITTEAGLADRERTRQAGMNAHLTKPIVPERLYRTIAELL